MNLHRSTTLRDLDLFHQLHHLHIDSRTSRIHSLRFDEFHWLHEENASRMTRFKDIPYAFNDQLYYTSIENRYFFPSNVFNPEVRSCVQVRGAFVAQYVSAAP